MRQLVSRHAQTLLAELLDADGRDLPRYVERELAEYLRCWILAHSFARVRCTTCSSGGAACIAADQALAFVDGQLARAERAAVEHRIDACVACRAMVVEAACCSGAERVREARVQSAVQRPAVTAALRVSHRTAAGAGVAAPGAGTLPV